MLARSHTHFWFPLVLFFFWIVSFFLPFFFFLLIPPSLSSHQQQEKKQKNPNILRVKHPLSWETQSLFVVDVKKDPGKKKKYICINVCMPSKRRAALGHTAECHPPPGQHTCETWLLPGREKSPWAPSPLQGGALPLPLAPSIPCRESPRLGSAIDPWACAKMPLTGMEMLRRSQRRRFSRCFCAASALQ